MGVQIAADGGELVLIAADMVDDGHWRASMLGWREA
jgi:hypothetical protein